MYFSVRNIITLSSRSHSSERTRTQKMMENLLNSRASEIISIYICALQLKFCVYRDRV